MVTNDLHCLYMKYFRLGSNFKLGRTWTVSVNKSDRTDWLTNYDKIDYKDNKTCRNISNEK